MIALCLIAVVFFFFLKAPVVQHENLRKEVKDEVTKSVRTQNKQSMIAAVPHELVVQNNSLGGSVKSMWKLTCDRRFMWLIPQLAWTGISIAYYSGNLVEMMTGAIGGDDTKYQFKWSMLAMVGFGFGEIFGGFFIGYIVDRCGSKVAILCNLVIILAMFGVTFGFII